MAKVPILLLAAGDSERMGQAKQLLSWGDRTLIEHQIGVLLKTGHPLYVVLGSRSEQIIPLVERFPVEIVLNRQWKRGMGTSIASGVKRVMASVPRAEGILITLVDQPLVPPDHYFRMLNAFMPGQGIILVSRSGRGLEGVPALFGAAYFKELTTLDGEVGAKKIIRAHSNRVRSQQCNEIGEDLDTPKDYQRLLAMYSAKSESK